MINQSTRESDEEKIKANNKCEEHNILTLAGRGRKSDGDKSKDRMETYRMMIKDWNKSEIYRKNTEKYSKKYKWLLEKIGKKKCIITICKKLKTLLKEIK